MFDFDTLKNDVMIVTFTKKNGEKRTMTCTTCNKYFDYVPKTMETVEDTIIHTEKKYPDNQVRVFDLLKQEWRSFLKENVIEMTKAPHHTKEYYIKKFIEENRVIVDLLKSTKTKQTI